MPVYLMKNERQLDVLPPAGRKGTFDGRYGCRKCFCVTFDKSNKIAVSGDKYILCHNWQKYKFMCPVGR